MLETKYEPQAQLTPSQSSRGHQSHWNNGRCSWLTIPYSGQHKSATKDRPGLHFHVKDLEASSKGGTKDPEFRSKLAVPSLTLSVSIRSQMLTTWKPLIKTAGSYPTKELKF